jgi:pimeloyl-ACP methyl ester carboxylesterase
MAQTRRRFMKSGAALGAGTAAGVVGTQMVGGSAPEQLATRQAGGGSRSVEKLFVLVHGSWHGSWVFERVTPLLVQGGDRVVARDLRGHGIAARFPACYLARDLAKFPVEPSPLAKVSQDDYAEEISTEVTNLSRQFPGIPLILVGHSFGGVTLTRVGEAQSKRISRLVYVAAFMLANGQAAFDVIGTPEFATSKLPGLLKTDPAGPTGALRIDFNSPDAADQAKVKEAFAADVSDARFQAVSNLLTPDEPAQPFGQPVSVTAQRWGSIPRTYVKTTRDQAIPPALQDVFIRRADELNPKNKTDVQVLNTSHSPFLSAPAKLARILQGL